ncbi:histidinol phosphate aminotransferase [Mameliella sediminis]|uniref:histidinol phosphate aminotransferase n=1 Tax=Mameliella sediminis TaxID=2836866 RepID=UPI001C46EE7E|nr:histidinol phosphate aminotransferase [Mameliella sediminis]MBV7394010.1 histidinol phosphate aminotransferase [Mameliella sediminis]MBY6115956.1 histidinol phosphate aminotransferase [Antarctobacter heliothermus]MBY6145266.1 histidinol phosphate aminotransferase [Mameliella alba]MCA0955014.1 histidinol phosphate aminotransferase [Mameliella alba]
MDNRHPQSVEDYTTANMILIFVNLLWVFIAIWSYWGLGTVLLLALLLNHLITRLETTRRRRDARFDKV